MINITSPFLLRLSKFLSNFFNPITSLFIYFSYYSFLHYSWQETSDIFLPILLITIIPITIWIFWNVKNKRYTNVDVSDRIQRKSLYFFIAAVLLLYLIYNFYHNNSFDLTMFFLLILIVMMQISNYFIKSSMHTSLNVFVAALFFSLNPFLGFIWLIISSIVGFTRIILKRHSFAEVLSGALIASVVSFIYLYTAINFQQ